jgi:hypothetical protein
MEAPVSTADRVPRYEFAPEQNQLIGGLAGKMRFVGFFAILAGLINLVMALLLVAATNRDRIPEEWKSKTSEYLSQVRDQLPEAVRRQAEQYSLDRLPADNQLWGIAIYSAAVAVFFLLLGAWTRSAGDSFRKIVETKGSDVTHLMDALGSLHGMYSLLYSILLIVLLVGVVSLALAMYHMFAS